MQLSFRRKLGIAVLAAGLVTGPAVLAAVPAQAAQQQVCAYGSECLNAWNGGSAVKIYAPGSSHEDFYWQQLYAQCGDTGYVDTSCPFVLGYGINNDLTGNPVGQVVYGPTGQCVGLSGTTAVLTGCNKLSTGTGGGTGTVFADWDGHLVNRAATNAATVASGEAVIAGAAPAGGGNGASVLLSSAILPVWSGL